MRPRQMLVLAVNLDLTKTATGQMVAYSLYDTNINPIYLQISQFKIN